MDKLGMITYLFKDSGLDKIDIKILEILRADARTPLNRIAKECRISKQKALYRINRMTNEGIITGFHTLIDYSKLGYSIYYIFIQTKYIQDEKEFIAELSKISGCLVIMKSITQYGYTIKLITQSPEKMMMEFEEFFNKNKNVTSHFIAQRLSKEMGDIEVDEKDRAILEVLHMDCRQSLLEISKITGLGYDTVNGRMKKLLQEKIIQGFITLVNFDKYGFLDYSVVLKFADHHLESLPVFIETLNIDPMVIEQFRTMGEFGYMFEVVDNNYVNINNKINRIRSQFQDMIRYSQIVPIQTHYFFNVKLG